MPGKQAENLLMSIKKSQACSTGTSRSIFPSKIMAVRSPQKLRRILCEKDWPDKIFPLIDFSWRLKSTSSRTRRHKKSVIGPIYVVLGGEEGCADCSETNWWDRTWL